MNKLVHWHNNTIHKYGTPEYPSKEAVYIYRTACAKELESTYQGKEYDLVQNNIDQVTCKPCLVWARAYLQQNTLINGNYIYNRQTN